MLPFKLPLQEELLLLQEQFVRRLDIGRGGLLLFLGIGWSLILMKLDRAWLGRTLLL